MNEIYIEKGGKKLRCGYTTGSCAQAAAKASLLMLLDNILVDSVSILTPKNILYHAEIADVTIEKRNDTGLKRFVSCAVIKDGGDDPDKIIQKFVKKHNLTNESKRQIKKALEKKLELL